VEAISIMMHRGHRRDLPRSPDARRTRPRTPAGRLPAATPAVCQTPAGRLPAARRTPWNRHSSAFERTGSGVSWRSGWPGAP